MNGLRVFLEFFNWNLFDNLFILLSTKSRKNATSFIVKFNWENFGRSDNIKVQLDVHIDISQNIKLKLDTFLLLLHNFLTFPFNVDFVVPCSEILFLLKFNVKEVKDQISQFVDSIFIVCVLFFKNVWKYIFYFPEAKKVAEIVAFRSVHLITPFSHYLFAILLETFLWYQQWKLKQYCESFNWIGRYFKIFWIFNQSCQKLYLIHFFLEELGLRSLEFKNGLKI